MAQIKDAELSFDDDSFAIIHSEVDALRSALQLAQEQRETDRLALRAFREAQARDADAQRKDRQRRVEEVVQYGTRVREDMEAQLAAIQRLRAVLVLDA
jgi:hypothetical protein